MTIVNYSRKIGHSREERDKQTKRKKLGKVTIERGIDKLRMNVQEVK